MSRTRMGHFPREREKCALVSIPEGLIQSMIRYSGFWRATLGGTDCWGQARTIAVMKSKETLVRRGRGWHEASHNDSSRWSDRPSPHHECAQAASRLVFLNPPPR